MGWLDDVIRDARRPLVRPGVIQREAMPEGTDEPEQPDTVPAAPIEEQDDGSWTVYRFQKAPSTDGEPLSAAKAHGAEGERVNVVPPADPAPVEPAIPAGPDGQHPPKRVPTGVRGSEVGSVMAQERSREPETATPAIEAVLAAESGGLDVSAGARMYSENPEAIESVSGSSFHASADSSFDSMMDDDGNETKWQRRQPGPGAPSEPLDGLSPAGGRRSSPAREEMADPHVAPRPSANMARDTGAPTAGPDTAAGGWHPESPVAGDIAGSRSSATGADVHIEQLEVQVIRSSGPARPSSTRPGANDIARRRYWRRL